MLQNKRRPRRVLQRHTLTHRGCQIFLPTLVKRVSRLNNPMLSLKFARLVVLMSAVVYKESIDTLPGHYVHMTI
jgi:hypothetical protein